MTNENTVEGDGKPAPSKQAFRLATAEIARERSEKGCTMFLARCTTVDHPIGAAELSPIEFDGVLRSSTTFAGAEVDGYRYRYVTDVVTDRGHRRRGVASALLGALEREVVAECGPTIEKVGLFLHVEEGNEAARGFYQGVGGGYAEPEEEVVGRINVDQLAENAGAVGQILLCKELRPVRKMNERSGGAGFGIGGAVDRTKRNRSKKRR